MKSTSFTLEEYEATLWDRKNEIEYIHNALQEPPQEHGAVYYFHGISGVGKSKLCDYTRRYLQAMFQAPYAMANIEMNSSWTETQITQNLYRLLVSYKELFFPRYEMALSYLFNLTQDPIYNITVPNKLSSVIQSGTRLAAELGASMIKIPFSLGVSTLSALALELASLIVKRIIDRVGVAVDEQIYKKVVVEEQKELEQFWNILNSEKSPNEVRYKLGEYFVEDLKDSLKLIRSVAENQNYYLFIIIDAFEKRAHTSSVEHLFQGLLENTGGITWFLFGTEMSIPQQSTQSINLHSYPVTPLNTEHLKTYLQKQGIDSDDDVNTIIDISGGLPAAIQIMLDIYRNNGAHLDKSIELQSYDALFQQYFSHHLTEAEQEIFFKLALFDYWDKEVFSYILQSSEHSNKTFEDIISKTSLVVKSPFSGINKEQYCLVDIVQKTLLARLNTDKNGLLSDAYRVKYSYEKAVSNRYLDQLKQNIVIGQDFNEKLRHHCSAAFYSGLKCYSNQEEFEEVSRWCTDTQHALSKRGLYHLKADLIKLYLDIVEQRDGFIFDTENNAKKMFRFRNMRDRIWAFRYSIKGKEAANLAGQYYAELMTKFGIFCPYIPFATYLWGLTFYDIGDYKTALWLLELSMTFEDTAAQKTGELISPLSAAVHNILGCLKMDLNQFKQAEVEFLEAQRVRSKADINGYKNTCSNLAKLYFRWAQETARKKPSSQKISRRLDLSRKYIDEYEALLEHASIRSITDLYSVKSRRIMLEIAQERLLGKIELEDSNWMDYFYFLEKAVRDLKNNSAVSPKFILSINHNLAIMYALQKCFDKAQQRIAACFSVAKKIYYDIEVGGESGKNKPAIRELDANLLTITSYTEEKYKQFNPYDFLIQF